MKAVTIGRRFALWALACTGTAVLVLCTGDVAADRAVAAEDLPGIEEAVPDPVADAEQLLERRAEAVSRTAAVLERTRAELRELETGLPTAGEDRAEVEAQLEALRLRLLRRTILAERATLKRDEAADWLALLRAEGPAPAPDPARIRAALRRRIERAEKLLDLLRGAESAAVYDRERRQVKRLLELQSEVLARLQERLGRYE
jgi:hypothetical protein